MITGIFFVLPCIESYQKVDLRTITLGVPPQEVIFFSRLQNGVRSHVFHAKMGLKKSIDLITQHKYILF